MGQLKEGAVFKPKMLNVQNEILKKRVFVVFNSIPDEGLEVNLVFLGKKALLPVDFHQKKICLMFTANCLNEYLSIPAFLELNYEDRFILSKFILPQQKILDWAMLARQETPCVKNIDLTIHFPEN